jgi:Transposase DDE domain group 1
MIFARVDGRAVMADFGGGAITSNAGRLLLGATDRATGLLERFAACFTDGRSAERVVHEVTTLVGQRVFGIALGYEDLVDHDRLRHDPVLGVVLGRLTGPYPRWRGGMLPDDLGRSPVRCGLSVHPPLARGSPTAGPSPHLRPLSQAEVAGGYCRLPSSFLNRRGPWPRTDASTLP